MDNDFYVGDVINFEGDLKKIVTEIRGNTIWKMREDNDIDPFRTVSLDEINISNHKSIDKIKFRDPNLCQHCPGRKSLCGNCFINKYPIKILPGDTVIYRNERGNYIGKTIVSGVSIFNVFWGDSGEVGIMDPYITKGIDMFFTTVLVPESQVSFYKRPENKKPRERCLSDMKKFCNGYCIYDCEGCKIKEILKKNG